MPKTQYGALRKPGHYRSVYQSVAFLPTQDESAQSSKYDSKYKQQSSQEIDYRQMPVLLAKFQNKVEDFRKVSSALNLQNQKGKVISSTIKSYFNTQYEPKKRKQEKKLKSIKPLTDLIESKTNLPKPSGDSRHRYKR